jgi:hypothetical protein
MAGDSRAAAARDLRLVSAVFVGNVFVLALGFGVVAGSAFLLGRNGLANVFASGTGFLLALAAALVFVRSSLIGVVAGP